MASDFLYCCPSLHCCMCDEQVTCSSFRNVFEHALFMKDEVGDASGSEYFSLVYV